MDKKLNINKIIVTPLRIIPTQGGDVYHAMKIEDMGYDGFGEAYFSCIDPGSLKAWKLHLRMTLNLIIPCGNVRVVCSESVNGPFREFFINNTNNYSRLTIPPMIWFGIQSLSIEKSFILNIANLIHDINEVKKLKSNEIQFDWSKS